MMRPITIEMALQARERAQERVNRARFGGSLTEKRHAQEAYEEANKRYLEVLRLGQEDK